MFLWFCGCLCFLFAFLYLGNDIIRSRQHEQTSTCPEKTQEKHAGCQYSNMLCFHMYKPRFGTTTTGSLLQYYIVSLAVISTVSKHLHNDLVKAIEALEQKKKYICTLLHELQLLAYYCSLSDIGLGFCSNVQTIQATASSLQCSDPVR